MATKKRVGTYRPIKTGVSGRYQLRVSGGPDPARPGKYLLHQKTVGPLNRRGKPLTATDLEKELAAFVAEVERGELPKTGITFGDLLTKYLAALEVQERQKSTLRTYRGLVRTWIRPRLGPVPLGKLTAEHFDGMYAAMREKGRAPGTINQAHAVCRKACNLAITWGYLTTNPTKGTSRPTVRRKRQTRVEPKDLIDIILKAGAEDAAVGTFLLVAAGSGCRRGEVAGIRWCDVDWENWAVHVQVAVGFDDDGSGIDDNGYDGRYGTVGVEVKDPKDHQDRTVDLPLTVVRALQSHRQTVLDTARFARVKVRPDGFVFSSDADGSTPPRPDRFTDAFARAREQAGVSGEVKMKDLRHLYGTLTLANGVPLATVSDMLGHDTRKTTIDYYNSKLPGSGRLAAAVMETAFGDVADTLGLPPLDRPETGTA